ncbi:MAG: exodeoxyribonuclease V subunit gamma [Proteobacteria bacterium]|nr:exodeoxyribonuclease V subunit gamma [Pseudomonadota bacterium]
MPGLNLFTSNRLELLVEKLSVIVREHPLPPLEIETVIIQSTGMARWISLELARRNKICANMEFPFPKPFVYDLFKRVKPLPDVPLVSPEIMTWQIMNALPDLIDMPGFESVGHYVLNDTNGLKLYQLSEKVASVFDQYLIYRPDIITKWDHDGLSEGAGLKAEVWQKALWQSITGTGGRSHELHHAALKNRFIEAIDRLEGLPKRISIFGISTLPPYYIDIFKALSRKTDVNLFYLNPCREYWEYAYNEKEIIRFSKTGLSDEDQYFDSGNSILSSMGVIGREFFSLVLNAIGDTGADLFEDTVKSSLLTAIQSDILNLVNSRKKDPSSYIVHEQDDSIRIFSCHSPVREIEVLHDTLLSLFDKDEDLRPRDVVVMMPDVSTYAPYVQAVFDTVDNEGNKIPYTIADTFISNTNRIATAFLSILSIGKNRFKAADILDILDNEAVYRKLGLGEEDLVKIRDWMKDTGISWGIDGNYKKALGLPDFNENTFQFGLDRMLLGYALPLKNDLETFSDILPYGEIEGEDGRTLGIFVEFLDTLFFLGDILKERASLKIWAERLAQIVSVFFIHDERTEDDIKEIRDTLTDQGLEGYANLSGFDKTITLDVVLSFLEKRLKSTSGSRGYIRSGVTFCTLLPMRSIPFRVVYILGMNDGDYPRHFENPGFSLMAQQKRLCDSSKRHEDRYLFLESLLSARDTFIVSYVGQSIKDNSDIPPSVLVAELIDYIDGGFRMQNNTSTMLDHVVTKHRLQPFSESYFKASQKLFSYSDENFKAAQIHASGKKQSRKFVDVPLPDPTEGEWSQIRLDQFCDFFRSPSRFFLQNRLNIQLGLTDTLKPPDSEPFDLDHLERYLIQEDLLASHISGKRTKAMYSGLKASGVLPHGLSGYSLFNQMETVARHFSEKISPHIQDRIEDQDEIDLETGHKGISISGRLSSLYQEGQVFYRTAILGPKDLIKAWIYHLCLNAAGIHMRERKTLVFGKEDAIIFDVMDQKHAFFQLDMLTGLFLQGLKTPVCFVPESSYAFSEAVILKNKGEREGLQKAYRKWLSDDYRSGEYDDPYNRLCFEKDMIDCDEFRKTAFLVFQPMFDQIHSKV